MNLAVDTHNSLVLSSPPAIAAALPHLLGFHPRESLVCLWLREREVLVVQRADLPGGGDIDEYARAYLAPAASIGADEVVIVCVTKQPTMGESIIAEVARRSLVPVRARLVVDGSRVRAMDGPGGWQWVSTEALQQMNGRFREMQRPVQRNRSDVVAEVEFDPSQEWEAPREGVSLDAREDVQFLAAGDFRGAVRGRRLRDIAMTVQGRDVIVWWCARSAPAQRQELLTALVVGLRATEPGESAHLAAATAAVAWMVGDGVRANAALDRCLREQPDHLFARLVERAIAAALAPAVFAGFVREMEPETLGLTQDAVDDLLTHRYSPS